MKEDHTFSIPILMIVLTVLSASIALASEDPTATGWQSPDEDILQVLHAQRLPRVWTAPGGDYLLLADPVEYPSLEQVAAPMHKLAGIRVDPTLNYYHGWYGSTSPRLLEIETGEVTPLELPEGAEVLNVDFTADGGRFALSVVQSDHVGLWTGSSSGDLAKIDGVALNYLLGNAVAWLPDQERLLVMAIPDRGPVPPASFHSPGARDR